MELKIITIFIYLILLIITEILIEKRIKYIYLKNHDKIGGGYGTYGIFLLYKRMIIVIRFLLITLILLSSFIIIILL